MPPDKYDYRWSAEDAIHMPEGTYQQVRRQLGVRIANNMLNNRRAMGWVHNTHKKDPKLVKPFKYADPDTLNLTNTTSSTSVTYTIKATTQTSPSSPSPQPLKRRQDRAVKLTNKEHLGNAVHFVVDQATEKAGIITEIVRNEEDGPDVERVGTVLLNQLDTGRIARVEHGYDSNSGTWHFPDECLEIEEDEETEDEEK